MLAESPGWVAHRLDRHDAARWAAPPAPGRWSALEVLCHLRDTDREVLWPRLERILSEDRPEIEAVDPSEWSSERGYRAESPRAVLTAWSEARRQLLALLAPLGPLEWSRAAIHSLRGHYPLGEMVREWVQHDLGHRRQLGAALGETA